MIWFFTPYSFQKKLFDAIDAYMNLVVNPNHWICLIDGDTAFLLPDFGHQIEQYVKKYPATGLFTCYASRCHYQCQVRKGTELDNPDILYHRKMAEKVKKELQGKVKQINRRVAGHLLVIKKSTWLQIRNEVKRKSSSKQILGVDTKISNAILANGMDIKLMRGMYIFHYLRLAEGMGHNKHLL